VSVAWSPKPSFGGFAGGSWGDGGAETGLWRRECTWHSFVILVRMTSWSKSLPTVKKDE